MSLSQPDPSSWSKAVDALARLTELPTSVVELGCDALRAVGGSRAVLMTGGMMGDVFSWWRWRNRVRIAHRAAEIMDRDGIARRIVPPSFLLPLLDAAGNVDDPNLQELWAQLLASGVEADEHQHPMWVRILAQMSREDARAFAAAAAAADLEGVPFVSPPGRPDWSATAPSSADARLHALGLVEVVKRHDASTPPEQRAFTAMRPEQVARPSAVGAQFRRAVMPGPAAAPASD